MHPLLNLNNLGLDLLHHSIAAGWGLDFVWPFLLRYPRDRIAVVDQVCMFHPPSTPNKANSVYNAGECRGSTQRPPLQDLAAGWNSSTSISL